MDVTTAVVLFAIAAAVAGIGYGLYLAMWVFKLDAGNKEMQSIALAIQEGASAYLNRQYKAVGVGGRSALRDPLGGRLLV